MKDENNKILMHPIGYVSAIDVLPDKFDYEVIKSLKSKIIINKKYELGLTGLKEGALIDVVYYMHKQKENKILFVPCMNNPKKEEKGIFSTRSQHSINSIGITTVKILEIMENNLIVLGLDAKDGSPVLDIKRHATEYIPN